MVSKVVTTPNGKVFFISTRSEALKETEKVTESSAQTEVLPTTGDKGSHAGLLGLGVVGKHLALLEDDKELSEVYSVLSNYILKNRA